MTRSNAARTASVPRPGPAVLDMTSTTRSRPSAVTTLVRDYVDHGGHGDEQFDVLTPRELDVLKLIAEAHTNREIAELLFISVKTVERHRQNILGKLGMRDRVELTRYAIRRGLIQA